MQSKATTIRFCSIAAMILFLSGQAGAQITAQRNDDGAALSIALYNKAVYVPGSDIFVRVTIANKSAYTWRFKLADDKRRSVSFDVRTLTNQALEASSAWKLAMSGSGTAFYRELSLEPGEEYSFIENVADYTSFTVPGVYVIRCALHPELLGGPDTYALKSNMLSVSLRPQSPTPSAAETLYYDSAELLKTERIGPDEVVSRTIRARQQSKWNEFFLYLDLERLLKSNADKKEAYARSSDEGRRRMITSYKADLMEGVIDKDIIVVPSSFSILETQYGPAYGKVRVLQKFAYTGFSMIKEYLYELEKRDGIWYIVAYTVFNKGSE